MSGGHIAQDFAALPSSERKDTPHSLLLLLLASHTTTASSHSFFSRFKSSFALYNCQPPSQTDKQAKLEWYVKYKESRFAVEMLKAKHPFKGMRKTFRDEIKKMLGRGRASLQEVWGEGSSPKVERILSEMKALLREFESSWKLSFGRPMGTDEKKAHEGEWYKLYKQLKLGRETLRGFETTAKKLSERWEDGKLALLCVYSTECSRGLKECEEVGREWKVSYRRLAFDRAPRKRARELNTPRPSAQ